jgi:hypothetical protein
MFRSKGEEGSGSPLTRGADFLPPAFSCSCLLLATNRLSLCSPTEYDQASFLLLGRSEPVRHRFFPLAPCLLAPRQRGGRFHDGQFARRAERFVVALFFFFEKAGVFMKSLTAKPTATATPPTPAQAELRDRILALIAEMGEASDIALWQRSAPQYFPWQPYVQELKALHAEGLLQFEMLAPGHWIVRSLAFVSHSTPQQKKRARTNSKLTLVRAEQPNRASTKSASPKRQTTAPITRQAALSAAPSPTKKAKKKAR